MRFLFFFLLFAFAACTFRAGDQSYLADDRPEFPKGTDTVENAFALLYQLGVHKGDTFLLLLDPANRKEYIGAFFWGRSKKHSDFHKIDRRDRILITSSVFGAMLEQLGLSQRVIGVDNGRYITSDSLSKRIADGAVKDIAPTGQFMSEKALGLGADLLLAYYIDAKGMKELMRMDAKGLRTVFIENYLEPHPLGRAEWIKVLGYMLGKPAESEKYYAEMSLRYFDLQEKARRFEVGPKNVLVNAPFQGIWDLPGVYSYMGQLLRDAHVLPALIDTSKVRISSDIEKVYNKGGQSEIWLNPGACRTYDCLLQLDKRLADFKAVKEKQVYNSTKLQTAYGGNAYWETGVIDPALVLSDIIQICYPMRNGKIAPRPDPDSLYFFEPLK